MDLLEIAKFLSHLSRKTVVKVREVMVAEGMPFRATLLPGEVARLLWLEETAPDDEAMADLRDLRNGTLDALYPVVPGLFSPVDYETMPWLEVAA